MPTLRLATYTSAAFTSAGFQIRSWYARAEHLRDARHPLGVILRQSEDEVATEPLDLTASVNPHRVEVEVLLAQPGQLALPGAGTAPSFRIGRSGQELSSA